MTRWPSYQFATVLAFQLVLFNGGRADQEPSRPREKADTRDDLWFHFVTRPDIQAPKFNVTIYDKQALSPGHWFVSPYEDATKFERGMPWVGPYIYDDHGDLIWAGTPLMDHFKLWDFKVADFDGTDMLTGISHRDNGGLIFNNNYELVKTVTWTPAWETSNMHEFNVVAHGSRVLVATKHEHMKLSVEMSKSVGFDGRCEVTADGIMELDIAVDPPRTVFEWRGIDHMPLKESINRPDEIDRLCTHNLDLDHFNSIDKFPDGDYLISARHTSTIYKVSHTDGSIVWRLGGSQSDFQMPEEVQFSRQHNARFVEQSATHTIISLFDNGYGWTEETTRDRSRGLVLALQTKQMKAELVRKVDHPLNIITGSRGNNQLLPAGNFFVCWVDHTRLSEHSPDGKLLMYTHLKPDIDTYRAYKFPWVGHPKQPPNVYAAAFIAGTDRITTITYVSWNGATEVASWTLHESDAEGSELKRLKKVPRRGFETRIMYQGYAKYVVVEALDHENQAIGRSKVVQTIAPVEEEETQESWVFSSLTNPISTFIAGFVACAVICAVMWCVMGSGRQIWWRSRGAKYEAAETEDREVLFGDDEEDEDAVELRDKVHR